MESYIRHVYRLISPSLSSWRAWIEILTIVSMMTSTRCRSPHGERGLKCPGHGVAVEPVGRSPHGERGLKCRRRHPPRQLKGRSPHGERGLKSAQPFLLYRLPRSLSSWRAWSEIGVCIVPATAWMLLSLFMSSVPRTCGIPHVRDCYQRKTRVFVRSGRLQR